MALAGAFYARGVAGLLRDKKRKPGLPPLPTAQIERVVELTLAEPPREATHWTGRTMAAVTGISLRSGQRIWAAHGLRPHRVRRFKLSQDPAFAAKLRDVVGLYLDPPAHSIVLSVDEKSQIQALDRTQPGLPIKHRGRHARRRTDPRDPRQLCRPQVSKSTRLARPAPALDFHFNANSCSGVKKLIPE